MFVALDTPILAGTSQGYGKCMGKLAAEKNERTDHTMDADEREKAAVVWKRKPRKPRLLANFARRTRNPAKFASKRGSAAFFCGFLTPSPSRAKYGDAR